MKTLSQISTTIKRKTILFLILFITFGSQTTFAQSKQRQSGFESAMISNIRQMDTASSPSGLLAIANNFERIANAESNKWEPFYYASYCYTAIAFMQTDKTKIDAIADKAEQLLQKAGELEMKNSEISCLFAMISSCRIMVDPMSRFPAKNSEIQALLGNAIQENASNPRIYLLKARMQMRTPEAFGGGKKAAQESLDKAIEKYKTFIPASVISPNWGSDQATTLAEKLKG